jgi:TolB-like protein
MSLFDELKRRNVFKVGVAYLIIAWLLLQVSDTLSPALRLPEWFQSAVALLLILGFPLALFFAWAFELTPSGLKKERDVERSQSMTADTGRKLNVAVIVLMAIALAFLAYDKLATETVATTDEPVQSTVEPAQPVDDTGDTGTAQSIAVLPFVNMSSDPEQEYFSDGLSEEILNLLAKIPDLKVIARTSSFAFKGINEDVRVIGDKLDVSTILEGSVRKSGDRVRVTAQLIDVSDGAHLWSETYDRTLDDIFAVQDDVAVAIVNALQVHVDLMPSRGRPTDSAEAYALFLKAAAALSANRFGEVEDPLLRAVELDPNFAEAHEALANHYSNMYEREKTRAAASKALSINPDLVLAEALLATTSDTATYLVFLDSYEQALRKQPGNPSILEDVLWARQSAGYIQDAMDVVKRWVAIDPLSVRANEFLAMVLLAAGRHDEAVEVFEFVVEIEQNRFIAPLGIGNAYLAGHQDELAIAQFETALQEFNLDAGRIRDAVTGARDPATGQAHLDRFISETCGALIDPSRTWCHTELTMWYLLFGFVDRYFEVHKIDHDLDMWEQSDEDHAFYGMQFRDQGFTAHPRFLELAEELGFVEIWEKHGPPDFCEKVSDQWVCE